MNREPAGWHRVANVDDVPSPSLLVYPDRIEDNIRKMLSIAGEPSRLWPHVKTHKLPEIVRLQQKLGITKFKCATIAEAEMVGACGAREVLLAYQPVGPNVRRLLDLIETFPATRFAAVVDHAAIVHTLSQAALARRATVHLFVDIDCGMGRTGLPAGRAALELYRLISRLPGLAAVGLHVYDGHIHEADPAARKAAAHAAHGPAKALRGQLLQEGLPVTKMVKGRWDADVSFSCPRP